MQHKPFETPQDDDVCVCSHKFADHRAGRSIVCWINDCGCVSYRAEDVQAVDQILSGAVELIEKFGWAQQGWSHNGAAPRCIRKAVWDSAARLFPEAIGKRRLKPLNDALRRISGAIYKPGAVGGITDWEYKKSTDKAAVIAVLRKAIDLDPFDPTPASQMAF